MQHRIKKILFTVIAAIMFAAGPQFVFAQEGMGGTYNDDNTDDEGGFVGLLLEAGAGYGKTIYGVVGESDSSSDLGTGPGGSYNVAAMLNLSILAAKFEYTNANYNDMEWKEEVGGTKYSYKTKGDGHFSTINAVAGLKLFTEPGDMGYTFFYGGCRYWESERNVDSKEANGVVISSVPSKTEMSGSGWIAGYQDVSTFPVVIFSIVFQTGLSIYQAPVDSIKVDGTKMFMDKDQSIGVGFNVGLGVAFEDIGLSVVGGFKLDVTATTFDISTVSYVAGAGYGMGFVSITKDISF